MFWFSPYFNIFMDGQNLSLKKLAKYENDFAFRTTFARLLSMALDRYSIDGVPETCSERVILQSLLVYGCVEFFEKGGNLLSLPAAPGAGVTAYGDFAKAWVYAANGILTEETDVYVPGGDESTFLRRTGTYETAAKNPRGVLVWENPLRFPFLQYVIYYARIISDSMRTLDIARKNLKNPYIVVAEESVVNSVKNFFRKRDTNEDYIVDSGIFPVDKIKLLPFDTNADSIKTITGLIDWYESRFRELCDIKANGNIDKKGENLLTAEVDINAEAQQVGVDQAVKEIQKGLDYVNEFFGTSMTVSANREEESYGAYDLFGDDSERGGDMAGESGN